MIAMTTAGAVAFALIGSFIIVSGIFVLLYRTQWLTLWMVAIALAVILMYISSRIARSFWY